MPHGTCTLWAVGDICDALLLDPTTQTVGAHAVERLATTVWRAGAPQTTRTPSDTGASAPCHLCVSSLRMGAGEAVMSKCYE